MSTPPQKRKGPSTPANPPADSVRAAKRVKISSARTILAQNSEKSLDENGDLNVSAFVKAREFEIRAMLESMASSKKSLSTRAFQQVPKEMRRRTASHNVKRVPKRLRARAQKEVSHWTRKSNVYWINKILIIKIKLIDHRKDKDEG